MASPQSPQPVTLICGAIFAADVLIDDIKNELVSLYGPVEFESDAFPFDKTEYYESEMGQALLKKFFAFKNLIDPGVLPDIKLATNIIEAKHAKSAPDGSPRRTVNLDPGYIALSKLVLASTKDFYHRIYLRDGIFAETTLRYIRGGFTSYEWTYPDFQTPAYLEFLNRVRNAYHAKLKNK